LFGKQTKTSIILFNSGFDSDDLIRRIIVPPTPKRDVFELSIFLYGYYREAHTGIRPACKSLNTAWDNSVDIPAEDIPYTQADMFPLFLSAAKLYKRPIDFSGEKLVSSFSHRPTRINYWHFQLFTQDDTGKVIPRNQDNSRLRHLAKHILENIVIPAICPITEVKGFQRIEFDGIA
jgi:hypothetical protein